MRLSKVTIFWSLFCIFDFDLAFWSVTAVVPGTNCGITVPIRVIEKGQNYKGPFLPCMLIEDIDILAKFEKTVACKLQ